MQATELGNRVNTGNTNVVSHPCTFSHIRKMSEPASTARHFTVAATCLLWMAPSWIVLQILRQRKYVYDRYYLY
jgi:hypothetical protein